MWVVIFSSVHSSTQHTVYIPHDRFLHSNISTYVGTIKPFHNYCTHTTCAHPPLHRYCFVEQVNTKNAKWTNDSKAPDSKGQHGGFKHNISVWCPNHCATLHHTAGGVQTAVSVSSHTWPSRASKQKGWPIVNSVSSIQSVNRCMDMLGANLDKQHSFIQRHAYVIWTGKTCCGRVEISVDRWKKEQKRSSKITYC